MTQPAPKSTPQGLKLNNRIWQVATLLVLLTVGFGWLVFLPGQRTLAKLREEIRNKKLTIDVADSLGMELQQVSTELISARDFSAAWRKQAPKAKRLTDAYSQISQHATQSKVTLIRFEPLPTPVPMAALQPQDLTLTLQGGFEDIFEFFSLLERSQMPIWSQNIRFQPTSESGQSVRCETTITIFADLEDNSD